jgi:NTP pyrophosphatase (non-canonical NTP hydrolase)
LAVAISVEASELLESFVWASDEQMNDLVQAHHARIVEEIADIAILITYLAHDLSIDIDAAVKNKIQVNAAKYPVEKVRGSNKKYIDL